MDAYTKYRVLIVEDEPLLLNYIAKKIPAVSKEFTVVGKACTGKDALQKIHETAPDVVFTDIHMPEMTGLELTSQIHNLYPNIIVVILTGYADFSYAQEAIRYHVFEYLLKPLNLDDLKSLLAAISLSLSSDQQKQALPDGITSQKAFELIREYMSINFSQPIDLQTLSKQFNYSSVYLIKLFKKYADTTPNRYLTQLRINAASQLLIHEAISIAQVGQRVGYNNLPHFSKLFKQYKNMSPAAYRATYSNIHLDNEE